jgi:hypothetical protein
VIYSHKRWTSKTGQSNPCANNYIGTVNDINIIDYLPVETDFVSASHGGFGFPPDYPLFTYDPYERTVNWETGRLSPGDSNSVTLTVRVNELAEPNGKITNFCKLESNFANTIVRLDTDICCYNPGIIYVDANAVGNNLGTSWAHAYTDLQDALDISRSCGCSEIWAAEGTYYSHLETGSAAWPIAFELVDGVGLYGGFVGYETDRSRRNWIKNQTILDGDIPGGESTSDTDHVVKATDVNESTILDGFIIQNGYYAGIMIDNALPIIKNVKIKDIVGYNSDNNHPYGGSGVYSTNNASSFIENCEIFNNQGSGIYNYDSAVSVNDCNIAFSGLRSGNPHDLRCGIYSELDRDSSIIRNVIRNSASSGIHFEHPPLGSDDIKAKNNLIFDNERDGIYINNDYVDYPDQYSTQIINNTIVYNNRYGYYCEYPWETIANCIFYYNNTGDLGKSSSGSFLDAIIEYNCIQDTQFSGNGNINSNPLFYADDVNNFHLTPDDSPCIDAGDPDFVSEPNETDIDGENRVIDGDDNGVDRVDMGADEYYWSKADFDANEIVNFIDYAMLANAWLTDDSDANYSDIYDLSDNNVIDNNDLGLFCEDWLWEAGWATQLSVGVSQARTAGMDKMSEAYSAESAIARTPQKPKEPIGPTEKDIEEIKQWIDELWELWKDGSYIQFGMEEDEFLKMIYSVTEWLEELQVKQQ